LPAIYHPTQMKKTLLCLLSFFLVHTISFCQNIKNFPGYAESLKINFTPPKNFIVVDCDNYYRPGNSMLLNSFFYELQSTSDSIIINFTILDLSHVNDSLKQRISPSNTFSKNLDFLQSTQTEADVKENKLEFYADAESKKVFNADNALSFKLRNSNPYKNRYPYCQVILLHKKDRADIWVYYWYNYSSKPKLESTIRQTKGILKFVE